MQIERGFREGYKTEGFYKQKEVDKEVILAKSCFRQGHVLLGDQGVQQVDYHPSSTNQVILD